MLNPYPHPEGRNVAKDYRHKLAGAPVNLEVPEVLHPLTSDEAPHPEAHFVEADHLIASF